MTCLIENSRVAAKNSMLLTPPKALYLENVAFPRLNPENFPFLLPLSPNKLAVILV